MKTFAIILMLFIGLGTSVSFPQEVLGQSEQDQALNSFQKLVDKFSSFFQTKQYLVYKQSYSESPTGVLVYVLEYSLSKDISYDVQKTQSLISPFIGYITLGLTSRENGSCGTVMGYKVRVGWNNADDAVKNIDNGSCYKYTPLDKPYVDEVRFTFAFQQGKWIFKDIIRVEFNKPAIAISTGLGKPAFPGNVISEQSGLEINKKWLNLIDPDAK
jgi:hypothetical protein